MSFLTILLSIFGPAMLEAFKKWFENRSKEVAKRLNRKASFRALSDGEKTRQTLQTMLDETGPLQHKRRVFLRAMMHDAPALVEANATELPPDLHGDFKALAEDIELHDDFS